MRKRGPDGTLQRRVFLVLKRASLCAAMIAERVGATREAVRSACWCLIEKKKVARHTLSARKVIYAAIGSRAPTDRRGKPLACRNHRGEVARSTWLRMMQKKHGPDWLPTPNDWTRLATGERPRKIPEGASVRVHILAGDP